jgi:site-specific DNA-methyltransferase (adenine-specific)
MSIDVWEGNCFEMMKSIPAKSIDAIITDPPYGTTALKWDKKIDLVAWWEAAESVIKDAGVVVMFSQQPFTTDLINSNRKHFRYEIIWRKDRPVGFLDANIRPLRAHENILVFSRNFRRSNDGKRAAATYNPQFTVGKPYRRKHQAQHTAHYGFVSKNDYETINPGRRFPVDVLDYPNRVGGKSLHPTQKNIDLVKWLVLTYTNLGELVLDPFAGSGTTLAASLETGRNAIGIEQDESYIKIIQTRIKDIENSFY